MRTDEPFIELGWAEGVVPVEVVNNQRLVRIDRRVLTGLARSTLVAVGRGEAGATLAFVRDKKIRELNREFRGKDRPTDVLSFPSDEGAETGETLWPSEPGAAAYLGDVVISTDAVLRQAGEAGHSLEREVNELVIHGLLHLCGYDHETDNGEMNRLELKLRRKLLDAVGAGENRRIRPGTRPNLKR